MSRVETFTFLALFLVKTSMHKLCLVLLAFIFIGQGCNSSNQRENSSFDNLSNDAHSYANFNEARTTHLNLDLTVDFEQKVLSGKATWDIDKTKKAKELILDIGNLKIKEITLDSNIATQ